MKILVLTNFWLQVSFVGHLAPKILGRALIIENMNLSTPFEFNDQLIILAFAKNIAMA